MLESVHATDAALRAEASSAASMGFAKLQAHMAQITKRCAPSGGRAEAAISPVVEPGTGGASGGASSTGVGNRERELDAI